MPPYRWVIVTCSKSNVSLVRRKRVLKSEDLTTDHVKLERPSILTKKILFCPAIGGGGWAPLSTPVVTHVLITSAMKNTATHNTVKLSANTQCHSSSNRFTSSAQYVTCQKVVILQESRFMVKRQA